MKRAVVLVLFCLIAVCICGKAGHARPDYHKQFEAMYKGSKIAAAAEKAKCLVCHFGKSKKDRNDYGTALSKSLTKAQYDSLKDKKDGTEQESCRGPEGRGEGKVEERQDLRRAD